MFKKGLKMKLFKKSITGQMPADNAVTGLISKYLEGNCNEVEREKLNLWLNADKANQEYFNSVKAIWQESKLRSLEWDENEAWKKMEKRISENSELKYSGSNIYYMLKGASVKVFGTGSPAFNLLRIAAVIIVVVSAVYLLNIKNSEYEITKRLTTLVESSSKRGELKKIFLPDGTVVTLNSASKLSYQPKFANTREVYLDGEAFFDVAHNPDKPFIVHLNSADIKVLGTKFNVKGWPEQKKYQVVVETGKVSFSSKKDNGNSAEVLLTKNQMSTMEIGKKPAPPVQVDAQVQTAWLTGQLIFNKAPLKEVIAELERKYDVSITAADNACLTRLLTASFKDESLETIIKTVGRALDLKYTMNAKEIKYY